MRRRLLPLLAFLAWPHLGQAQTVLDLVRAGQWPQADALAATAADPLQRKLVLYYRVLTPGAARAAEIAAFMADNPDWPNQAALSHRLQDALLLDHDDRTVLAICQRQMPTAIPSLLRCAEAESKAPPFADPPGLGTPTLGSTGTRVPDTDGPAVGARLPSADGPARRAWITGITDAPGEAAFLKRWGAQITPDDQWRRFDRLAWTESAAPGSAAARQALRLPPTLRAEAETRLALKRDDATAPALFNTLPPILRTDPTLLIELARWYRRAGLDRDAAIVWTGPGPAAEAAAPPDRRTAFWDERNLLARRLLRANEPALAYAVADPPATSPDTATDQAFLAGWIALRRLQDPAAAIRHFALLAASHAAITQARAHYWLGRAQSAAGHADDAAAEYARAATWPTTYYGQLAALARGTSPAATLTAAQDPGWNEQRAIAFLAQDPARAAILLTAWGEPRRAKAFLARLDERATDPTERALAARLALGLGLPEQAVAIARRAGRDGVMLPAAGWPAPIAPPPGPVEGAVILALIRQESSFDVQALSPVGARGLMQLMPATAAGVAKRLGLPPDLAALTTDAAYNMRLGTSYLQGLLTQFGGALPLAIASYNAGPSRVQDWLIATDPAAGPLEMIDWIELIPFNETRNYVQRVIENIVVYRAQLGAAAPHPVEPRGAVPG